MGGAEVAELRVGDDVEGDFRQPAEAQIHGERLSEARAA